MIPEQFYLDIGAGFKLITIGYFMYMMSHIYKNIVSAHRKENRTYVEYKGCTIHTEKMEL